MQENRPLRIADDGFAANNELAVELYGAADAIKV